MPKRSALGIADGLLCSMALAIRSSTPGNAWAHLVYLPSELNPCDRAVTVHPHRRPPIGIDVPARTVVNHAAPASAAGVTFVGPGARDFGRGYVVREFTTWETGDHLYIDMDSLCPKLKLAADERARA